MTRHEFKAFYCKRRDGSLAKVRIGRFRSDTKEVIIDTWQVARDCDFRKGYITYLDDEFRSEFEYKEEY